jgi:hypothetical protein
VCVLDYFLVHNKCSIPLSNFYVSSGGMIHTCILVHIQTLPDSAACCMSLRYPRSSLLSE